MYGYRYFVLVALLPVLSRGFPDGAPVDACVKDRPNQPYHGQAQPQPPEDLPYNIVASSSHYGPGTKITELCSGSFGESRPATCDDTFGEWSTTCGTASPLSRVLKGVIGAPPC